MCPIIIGRGIPRSSGDIPKDQPEMTEPPWLIAIKASDRASGAADHHDLEVGGASRIILCPATCPLDKKTRFGKCWAGEPRETAARVA
jgi:hypothetical protein